MEPVASRPQSATSDFDHFSGLKQRSCKTLKNHSLTCGNALLAVLQFWGSQKGCTTLVGSFSSGRLRGPQGCIGNRGIPKPQILHPPDPKTMGDEFLNPVNPTHGAHYSLIREYASNSFKGPIIIVEHIP